jgi:hypothetical protein
LRVLFVILSAVSDMQVSFIRNFVLGSVAETLVRQLRVSLDCFYSELCDCYLVQFSITTLIVQLIGVTVNCVTVI